MKTDNMNIKAEKGTSVDINVPEKLDVENDEFLNDEVLLKNISQEFDIDDPKNPTIEELKNLWESYSNLGFVDKTRVRSYFDLIRKSTESVNNTVKSISKDKKEILESSSEVMGKICDILSSQLDKNIEQSEKENIYELLDKIVDHKIKVDDDVIETNKTTISDILENNKFAIGTGAAVVLGVAYIAYNKNNNSD